MQEVSRDIFYQTIEKWDGVMPKVASSASPLLMIDVDEQEQQSSDK